MAYTKNLLLRTTPPTLAGYGPGLFLNIRLIKRAQHAAQGHTLIISLKINVALTVKPKSINTYQVIVQNLLK